MKFPKLILLFVVIPIFYSCGNKQVKPSYELDSLILTSTNQADFFKVYKKADFKFTDGEDSLDAVMLPGTAREVQLKWDFFSDGKWMSTISASKAGWYAKSLRVPVGADLKTLTDSLTKRSDSVELAFGGANELIYPVHNKGDGEQTLIHFVLPAGSEELKATEKYSMTTPFLVKLNPVITSVSIIIAQHSPAIMQTDVDDPRLGDADPGDALDGSTATDDLQYFLTRVNSKRLELPITLAASDVMQYDSQREILLEYNDKAYLPIDDLIVDDTVTNYTAWVHGSVDLGDGLSGIIWAIKRADVSFFFSVVGDAGKIGGVTQLNYANNNPGNCIEHHKQISTLRWNSAKDGVLINIADTCRTTCPGLADSRLLRKFSIRISKDGSPSDLKTTEKKL